MENPIKVDDLGGTTIFGNIHMGIIISQYQDPLYSMELRWVFFLGRKSSSPFWVQPAFGRSFPHLGWIHLSDERAVEIFESELFSGQVGKGTGKNKAFHSQFLFKGNLGYLEPKKKRSLWKVGIFFWGGERCFTNGPHPKMYKNACWDHGSSDESRENPPRLDAQGSDFRIKVPWVFTNEKVTWANTNQSSIYYLFQGCFLLLYLCSLITHSVFVFDADFKSSNVASDFFLNICLKQFSQKIVGFFGWKCDRKMAMNFSIRRFMSTMRWRRCWRRLSLAFLSAICSYILDLFKVMFYFAPWVSSPCFTTIWDNIFLELFPRIGHKNRRYSFLPLFRG